MSYDIYVLELMTEKEILKKLLIDESETLLRTVQKSEKIFKIDKKTGETIFVAPRAKLADREKIAIVLLGRYFANRLELSESETLTTKDVASQVGMDEATTSARLSDLRRERIVEPVSRGEYRISYANSDRILDEILNKLEKIGGRS